MTMRERKIRKERERGGEIVRYRERRGGERGDRGERGKR